MPKPTKRTPVTELPLVVDLGEDRILLAQLEAAPRLCNTERDEVEDAWTQIADRRESELESGSITCIPGPEAVARLRATLSR